MTVADKHYKENKINLHLKLQKLQGVGPAVFSSLDLKLKVSSFVEFGPKIEGKKSVQQFYRNWALNRKKSQGVSPAVLSNLGLKS